MRVAVFLLTLGASMSASAVPVWSQGAGAAVERADAVLTFDEIATYDDLCAFTASGVSVTVGDTAFVGFDPTGGRGGFENGFFYANGGNESPYIVDAGGDTLLALEFTVGSGFVLDRRQGKTQLSYETFRDGVSTGSGSVNFSLGAVFGLRDAGGFDTLHLYNARAGATNALALDYLLVERALAAVPEPAPLALLMVGALAFRRVHRRAYSWRGSR